MRTLYVICSVALFHLISSKIVDDENNEDDEIRIDDVLDDVLEVQEPSKYSDHCKTLKERVLVLIKDPEFRQMTYEWYQFLISDSDNNDNDDDDEDSQHQHVKPRKGVNYTARSIREADNERTIFYSPLKTFLEYIIPSKEYSEIIKHLVRYYVTDLMDDDEDDSNFDESICDISWSTEKIRPPFEFINWLPICPCVYPNEYIYTKTRGQNDTKEYWWQIVTNPKVQEKDIRCTKIEAENNVTLVSKHCCYDTNDFLITRGPNTGNIYYMTKDLTKEIRTTFQLYPTVKCNFLRLIKSMPTNDDNWCVENPRSIKIKRQTERTNTIDTNHEREDITKKR